MFSGEIHHSVFLEECILILFDSGTKQLSPEHEHEMI